MYAFDVESSEFVQVLHNGHGYWLMISNTVAKEGKALVYNSLYPTVSSRAKWQIAAILVSECEEIKLKHMDVCMCKCSWEHIYDSGLFAIASATALVYG